MTRVESQRHKKNRILKCKNKNKLSKSVTLDFRYLLTENICSAAGIQILVYSMEEIIY